MDVYTHMYGSPKLIPGIFLDNTPCYLLRQDFSLNLELRSLVSLTGQLCPWNPVSASRMLGLQETPTLP